MINQFSGNAAVPPPQPSANSQPISEEKTARLNEILSDYDAENLSNEDALTIVSQINELGIDPGAGLAKIMSGAGFDARTIGDQTNISPNGSKSPSPPLTTIVSGSTGTVNKDAMIALNTLIESEGIDDWANIQKAMTEKGFDMSQPIINIRA